MADKDDKKKNEQENPDLTQKMLQTRTILLTGEVNKELSEKVIKQLLLLEADSDEPIKIFIDSPGGEVYAGFAIYDMIRFIKPEVYCIGMGLVASIASIILIAVPNERRIALPNSQYLIHQPLSGLKGVATEIEIHANELEKMRVKLNKLIASESKQDEAKVSNDTDRDYWMTAVEAKEYNLVSKIITIRSELGL